MKLLNTLTRILFGAAVCATAVTFTRAADYPTPAIAPTSWQLDFEHSTPKRIVVETPNSSVPKAYWYMLYTVTNNTDREQMFFPVFEMMTNGGQILRSDKNVPQVVFDAIKRREHKQFLEPFNKIQGELRIGEDQARDGVAIWEEPTPRMGHFNVFVSGLSGEVSSPKDADGKPAKDAKGEQIFLRKTLELNYHVPGDEVRPGEDALVDDGSRWIMR